MTDNGAIETFEIERKYDVADATQLPGAQAFAAIGLRLGEIEVHELRASYFDTPEGGLASQRVGLRERVGGKDEGWHLKAKGDEGARELLWAPAEEMPEGLRRELEDRLGGAEVDRIGRIATLRTQRVTAMLFDADGTAVIEFADDRVDALNEMSGRRQQWREWEAELMPGVDAALLDAVEPVLEQAGATRVRGTSKIQRTMRAEGAQS